MAPPKRRARTAPVDRTRDGAARRAARARRKQNGWLLSLLGIVTVLIVIVIAAIAVNRSNGAATATPTSVPGFATPSGTFSPYHVAPSYGIGVLNETSGLAQRGSTPKVGQQAPDFSWTTVTGPTHLAALQGHPVLLEFFAPWCPQCQHDAPLMNSFAVSPEFKGLQVLAVSASPYGKDYETKGSETPISMSDMTWYKSTFGTLYPLIFDPNIRVFNLYGYGSGYPTFWIIDKSGKISFGTSTTITPAALTAQVKKVL